MEAVDTRPKNGHWQWDTCFNQLYIISNVEQLSTKTMAQNSGSATVQKSKAADGMHSKLNIKFKDTVDPLEQVRFRRHCQRKCSPNEPEVITLQDIKDVALFLAPIHHLNTEFINFFHIPTMDRLLRSLILYFQFYIQEWEKILIRRGEFERKLYQPIVRELEDIVRDDIADLRSMVSREHCTLLIGAADAKKYHHMSNKNNISLAERDCRLMELLNRMCVHVTWLAVERKHHKLIAMEVNRLLRTDSYNVIKHGRGMRHFVEPKPNEVRILHGLANTEESKLMQRSPVAKEMLLVEHDYRIFAIGSVSFEPSDDRLKYFEIAYSAPEDKLKELGVTVGILGQPRADFDAMLNRKIKKNSPHEVVIHKIPPRPPRDVKSIPDVFPQTPPTFSMSPEQIESIKKQSSLWRKMVKKAIKKSRQSLLSSGTAGTASLLT